MTTVTAQPPAGSYWPADTSVALSDLTVGGLLTERAAQHPDTLALVATGHDGTEVRLTYAELLDRARGIAAGLLELAEPGEFVAIWAPNVAEWPLVQYGAALAGVVLVAVNPVLRGHELAYALEHSGAVVLLHADVSRDYDMAAVVAQVAPSCPALRTTISLAQPDRFTAPPRGGLPVVGQLDPVMLQYTSGTTGLPKGVLLHHRALVNNAKLTMEATEVSPGAVCLNPLPMFHTAACVIGTLGPAWIGGTTVLLAQFTPPGALAAIRREGVTVHMAVPAVLGGVLEAARNGEEPAPHLERVLVGAANVPATMIEAVEEVFGASVHNLFGQTELAPVMSVTRRGDTRADQVGSVGRAVPQLEVRIVDPATGEVTPCGSSGEICEIENVLVTHPAVLDAAVVGLPDEHWGEVVAAAVRLRAPLADAAVELTVWCRERLAPFKVPVRVDVVDGYPMTPSGKVQKFRLREQLTGEPAP